MQFYAATPQMHPLKDIFTQEGLKKNVLTLWFLYGLRLFKFVIKIIFPKKRKVVLGFRENFGVFTILHLKK